MSAYTFEELKKKTVAQLREIAHGLESETVKGYSQLNKEHLLAAVCQALHVDMHAHRQVVGLNKSQIKAKIRMYKEKRNEALATQDHGQLKFFRQRIHELKRQIHRATTLE